MPVRRPSSSVLVAVLRSMAARACSPHWAWASWMRAARRFPSGGAGLAHLARIDLSRVHPALSRVKFRVACDVDCPLLGVHGAARLFGPQKGATVEGIEELERNLEHFAELIRQATGREVRGVVAGGAAGGMAAGLFGILGASLEPGIDLVLETIGFDQALAGANLVLTAEGSLDQQSLRNKGPCGVGRWAKRRNVPVIALAGAISDDVRLSDFRFCGHVFDLQSAHAKSGGHGTRGATPGTGHRVRARRVLHRSAGVTR